VSKSIQVEIKGKDEFWGRAFHVEWEHRFPDRNLVSTGRFFLADGSWLDDLERVAGETFCDVLRAPENPRRRQWINALFARRGLTG
jgi:hypothetical protein